MKAIILAIIRRAFDKHKHCTKCGGFGHQAYECKWGKPKARSAWWR